ncbi:hypothetical protein [Alkaliphilus sp. B6464]|uniref:hypothetical protein n=1 Tax=Alkaliphilus sp. B6464 TaxID=2731219 RepID=UPI001BA9EDB7|nr:hypothetical protein [Alkaliphilus sp. B6464]QUH21213.1 hypothetical protein HYG84_15860 [Alkaliphilus sp. B6464]
MKLFKKLFMLAQEKYYEKEKLVSTLFMSYSYNDVSKTHSMMRLDAIKNVVIYLSGIVTFWGYLIWKEWRITYPRARPSDCNSLYRLILYIVYLI